jgi:DNA polymerase
MDKKVPISKIHGQPQNRNGVIIFPTFHPAAAMRFPKIRGLIEEDFKKIKKMRSGYVS